MFLRCVGDWVSRLPDRYDHLPRLIPYLLSGMFDDFQEIRETCFEVLEEAGQEEEREKVTLSFEFILKITFFLTKSLGKRTPRKQAIWYRCSMELWREIKVTSSSFSDF